MEHSQGNGPSKDVSVPEESPCKTPTCCHRATVSSCQKESYEKMTALTFPSEVSSFPFSSWRASAWECESVARAGFIVGRVWGRNTAFPRISTPHLLLLYPSALQQCLTTGLTSAMGLLPHLLASGTSGSSGMCFIIPLHHQNVLKGTQSSACKLERDQHPSHAPCTFSGGLGHLGWSPAAWEITRSWGDVQGGEFYPHCRAPRHLGRTLHHPGQRCFLCY